MSDATTAATEIVICFRSDGSSGKVGTVKIAYRNKEQAATAVIEQMANGWFPFVYDERVRCTFAEFPAVLQSEVFELSED